MSLNSVGINFVFPPVEVDKRKYQWNTEERDRCNRLTLLLKLLISRRNLKGRTVGTLGEMLSAISSS